MLKEYVENHIIFESVVGSVAYGLNDENSDIDIAGVMIPGKEYFYGIKSFEQYQGYETDKTIYNIKKIIKLIIDNNPNCLDLLCPPEKCIIKNTSYWKQIMDSADLFISKKCKFTYSGYAISQLKRIKTHRKYLLNKVIPQKPNRKDFNLSDVSIFQTAQLKSLINIEALYKYVEDNKKTYFINELDDVYSNHVIPIFKKYISNDRSEVLHYIQQTLLSQLNTFKQLGLNNYIKDEYIVHAENELLYQNKYLEWKSYNDWLKNRNEKRIKLEQMFGYDTKHAMHLIRLLRMGYEILSTGKINVDRTNIDAKELMDIRKGKMSYDDVEKYCCDMDKKLTEIYNISTLQNNPQVEKIDKLCIQIIDNYLYE